jgi:glycine C-acetyltransferase
VGRVSDALAADLRAEIDEIRAAGLYKHERPIASPQSTQVALADGERAINLCANDYLGLANHAAIVAAAHEALERWGYGMASVRFICGTQSLHKELEQRLTEFLGTEDTILYGSCFDANGGLFETLLGPEDAVISDALNHASIIDGVRLCKAQRLRYANGDLDELEARLRESAGARRRLIVSDGVFSMDGVIAPLAGICELAERHGALVMVDDSHATGFVGAGGRGSHELHGVIDRVDILTGTLGKALGGASGGYTSGRREVVELLRQRSRPYLFSNALAPPVVAAALEALDLVERGSDLRDRLWRNTALWRERLTGLGFTLAGGGHPIVPVMFGDARVAGEVAERLLAAGIYVVAFSYPVVPKGAARIRTQLSAGHSEDELERAAQAFRFIGKEVLQTG